MTIYFHGNTRSIKGWAKYSRDFTNHGYGVIVIDYSGFGKSKSKCYETAMKKDAHHVHNEMKFELNYTENKIMIDGRTLGSGFVVKLASSNRPEMLVLDGSYNSLSQFMNRFLPFRYF